MRICKEKDCNHVCYGKKDICKMHYSRIWRANNPNKMQKYNLQHKQYIKENKEKIKQQEKVWREKNKEKCKTNKRNWQIQQYGITKHIFLKLQREQNKQCKICGRKTNLVIDHNHVTKRVRGLLCPKCNLGLGHFNDNIENLKNAIKYLELGV